MEKTISAVDNPQLASRIASEALQQIASQDAAATPKKKVVAAPPVGVVELLAGHYDSFTGELATTAEVRELTGADEEAIAKAQDIGKGLLIILQRATVSIGDSPASLEILDSLLSGDRELLLMNIRKVTFGNTIDMIGPCPGCGESDQKFTIDLDTDVPMNKLNDPVEDRTFTLSCKLGEVTIALPTGKTQKKLIQNSDKTSAELDTLLLVDCVQAINGMTVYDKKQILNMGLADRRKILQEIGLRNPGPDLSEIKKNCPACSQEVTIPLSLAELFRS